QFTVAEAYFEMAKKHRELGQEDLAHKEIAQGKKLLEEAIRDYPNTAVRAQADYLLADLALEGAKDVGPDEVKKRYIEAIVRFSDIVATYPDSTYAPKAQYKKALIFEKTGQMDQACEEYVKLSYRYPDNELVAETIYQLGKYFRAKGKKLQDEAKSETDKVLQEKGSQQARDMFKTSAQVFGRLAQRFPEHKFANAATVLSAECWMLAEDLPKAIEVFRQVINEKKAEPDLIARSMFWAADCYTKFKQPDYVNAYRLFKRLTWDYPESTWAKNARGRLSEDALARVEQNDSSADK
ncbi:MAG: tetratricopeptide repeat protein, partial [Verrucomicrobiota bacterium]